MSESHTMWSTHFYQDTGYYEAFYVEFYSAIMTRVVIMPEIPGRVRVVVRRLYVMYDQADMNLSR